MKKTRLSRDLQNIPIREIDGTVRKMPHLSGFDQDEKKILVTIYLNRSTVRYFKKQADKHHTKYQRLVRAILVRYVALRA